MSEQKQFRLPDVGEGLTEADIVSWHVKPGDEVAVNQVIVEIETAKAVVELPCPFDGVVAALLVAEGQTVDVGTPIIAVDVAGSPGAAPAPPVTSGPAGATVSPPAERDAAGGPAAARGGGDQVLRPGGGQPVRGAARADRGGGARRAADHQRVRHRAD